MKKTVKIILLLVAAVLAAGSCKKEIFSKKGEKIHFTAGSASDATKTVYGDFDSEAKTQAINWVVGDQIKIAGKNCPVGIEGSTDVAKYKVTEVNPDGRGLNFGKIGLDDSETGIGLVWGDPGVFHNFFAVYPGSADVTVDGIITGSIPEVQGIDGTPVKGTTSQDVEATIVKPDMKNLFMVAKALNVESGSTVMEGENPLFLDFLPISTALEFTIQNGFDSEGDKGTMTVKSVGLERNSSTATTNVLNGGFTVTMTEDGVNKRPKTVFTGTNEDSRGRVSIDFGSNPIPVAKNQYLNFTFFLNAGNSSDVNDLYFKITFVNYNGETITRRALMQKADGTKISFPTHKKTRISGLIIPESMIFDIEGEVVVVPWNEGVDGEPTFEKTPPHYFEGVFDYGPGVEIDGTIWAPVNCGIGGMIEGETKNQFTYGKLYQWGREVGFGYYHSTYSPSETNPTITTVFTGTRGTEDPKTWYKSSSASMKYNYDWIQNGDNNYWDMSGNSSSTTKVTPVKGLYDPCPMGWRIPTYYEFNQLKAHYSSFLKGSSAVNGQNGYYFSGSSVYSEDAPKVFLPASGSISSIGDHEYRGTTGAYWTSTVSSNKAYRMCFNQDGSTSDPNVGSGVRANAFSIRCVYDGE